MTCGSQQICRAGEEGDDWLQNCDYTNEFGPWKVLKAVCNIAVRWSSIITMNDDDGNSDDGGNDGSESEEETDEPVRILLKRKKAVVKKMRRLKKRISEMVRTPMSRKGFDAKNHLAVYAVVHCRGHVRERN